MAAFVQQGVQAVQTLQQQIQSGHFDWVNRLWLELEGQFQSGNVTSLSTMLSRYAEEAAGYIAARLGTLLKNTAQFLFHLSVTILAMFYLFRDGESIVARVRELLPFEAVHRDRMMEEAHDLIFATVIPAWWPPRRTASWADWHLADRDQRAGFLGRDDGIFFARSAGWFRADLGSGLRQSDARRPYRRGIILAMFCSVVVGMVDNFVRPWLISGRAEMGRLVIFISVLGGISVFGLLGSRRGADRRGDGGESPGFLLPVHRVETRLPKRVGRRKHAVLE